MTEKELVGKALSCLHASEETITEVLNMKEKRKAALSHKTAVAILVAACLLLALGISSVASYTRRIAGWENNAEINILAGCRQTSVPSHPSPS